MKKEILNHLTVTGFANNTDLSKIGILEKEHTEAKGRRKLAKKDEKVRVFK